MRLGLCVNDIHTEWPHYTTTRLAMAAASRHHEVFYIEAGGFGVDECDRTRASALEVPKRSFRAGQVLLRQLQTPAAKRVSLNVDELDVLLLRNNPSDDAFRRPWARLAPLDFGLLAARHGVIVLNDPVTLAQSLTKLYLQKFLPEVRPKTLVTRDRDEAKRFVAAHGGHGVLKPLFGSGGHNVFLVRPEDAPNVNQMFEAVAADGYVIVQEYLPMAVKGDTRLFLMDGQLLRDRGKVAAVARVRGSAEGDMRSNITAGAGVVPAVLTDEMIDLARTVGPQLAADGIFLAGLDVVGDKIMEINILTPGALGAAEQLEGVNFSRQVIRALEQKVAART